MTQIAMEKLAITLRSTKTSELDVAGEPLSCGSEVGVASAVGVTARTTSTRCIGKRWTLFYSSMVCDLFQLQS